MQSILNITKAKKTLHDKLRGPNSVSLHIQMVFVLVLSVGAFASVIALIPAVVPILAKSFIALVTLILTFILTSAISHFIGEQLFNSSWQKMSAAFDFFSDVNAETTKSAVKYAKANGFTDQEILASNKGWIILLECAKSPDSFREALNEMAEEVQGVLLQVILDPDVTQWIKSGDHSELPNTPTVAKWNSSNTNNVFLTYVKENFKPTTWVRRGPAVMAMAMFNQLAWAEANPPSLVSATPGQGFWSRTAPATSRTDDPAGQPLLAGAV